MVARGAPGAPPVRPGGVASSAGWRPREGCEAGGRPARGEQEAAGLFKAPRAPQQSSGAPELAADVQGRAEAPALPRASPSSGAATREKYTHGGGALWCGLRWAGAAERRKRSGGLERKRKGNRDISGSAALAGLF